jgi:hypothetical protein
MNPGFAHSLQDLTTLEVLVSHPFTAAVLDPRGAHGDGLGLLAAVEAANPHPGCRLTPASARGDSIAIPEDARQERKLLSGNRIEDPLQIQDESARFRDIGKGCNSPYRPVPLHQGEDVPLLLAGLIHTRTIQDTTRRNRPFSIHRRISTGDITRHIRTSISMNCSIHTAGATALPVAASVISRGGSSISCALVRPARSTSERSTSNSTNRIHAAQDVLVGHQLGV